MKKKLIVYIITVVCLHAISLSKPKSANDWFLSGYSKYDRKDYHGAIADCTKAIELNPNFGLAYIGRGLAERKLNNYQGAIADFTKAIELKPDNANAFNNRGFTKNILKDYQGAIADCTKAIELKPNYADAYNNRGISYLGLGLKAKALADFMEAKKMGYDVPKKFLDMCK